MHDDSHTESCPVCAETSSPRLETYHDPVGETDYELFRCRSCGLSFSVPFRAPGREWYEKFNYFEGMVEAGAGTGDPRGRCLLDHLPAKSGRLLDVGCGGGNFLRLAQARGYEVGGLELDRRLIEHAHAAGLAGVQEGTLDAKFADENAGAYDAVGLLDVIEHLEDPVGALRRVREVLKPGGYVLISVPNDLRPMPFGRDFWDYPPHHLTRWTPRTLERFLNNAGFEAVELHCDALPVWYFSRTWADRSARFLLRLIKRLLFGGRAAGRPMDQLLEIEHTGGGAAVRTTFLPAKSLRVRLVSTYHTAFHLATSPFFLCMKLYYKLTRPRGGNNLLALARSPAAP